MLIMSNLIEGKEAVAIESGSMKECHSRILSCAKLGAAWSAVLFLMQPDATFAQQFPEEIESPVIDEYGVELKSGRYGGLNVPIIAIGGSGDSSLSRVYSPQNGREMLVNSIFDVHTAYVNFGGGALPDYYSVVTFRYPGGNVRFRRKSGTSNPWVAEFATGATYDGSVFTDKNGIKIQGSKITFPDGREVWGGTYSVGIDPNFHVISDMRNNFGFQLRTVKQGSTLTTQAVNMAVDYCDLDFTAQCQGLDKTRTAVVQTPSRSKITLSNAEGETTVVDLIPIQAYDSEPTCDIVVGSQYQCRGTTWSYYYPSQVKFPGSSSPNISISYVHGGSNAGPPPYGSTTHDEILIDGLVINGMTVTYNSAYWPNGSWGGQNGHQITVSSSVAGQGRSTALSKSFGIPWPMPNLDMEYIQDGLGRSTSFDQNAMGTLSKITYPGGRSVERKFDSRYNVIEVVENPKSGSSDAPLKTIYEYPASCTAATQAYCNLPKAMIDPKGNRTDYTYNTRGQVTSVTEPAAEVGAARSKTTYSYTMRTAYVLTANGGTAAAGAPISMLTKVSQCQTTENCAGTVDEIKTQYDYGPTSGPNNLLLRGLTITAANAAGQMETQRTCYTYNYFGERIAETSPKAGMTSCQ